MQKGMIFMQEWIDYKGYKWLINLQDILAYISDKDRIYIYGAGEYGKVLNAALSGIGVQITSFVISNQSYISNDCDMDVKCIDDVRFDKATAIVLCSGGGYVEEMIRNLEARNYSNYYVFQVISKKKIVQLTKGKYLPEQCRTTFQDGFLRLRITNRCPGKCDFCGQKEWTTEENQREMDPFWYMKWLRPLYPSLKSLLITGGDSFYAKESYSYMKMISMEYPHISIITESNGLTFTERFRELACANLFMTCFSLNASNEKVYSRGCWTSEGGKQAYKICRDNIEAYIDLLKAKDRLCFAPSLSMVINKNTFNDVVPFVELALRLHARNITFYFDYRENDMYGDYFSNPGYARETLKILLEIEKMLQGRVFVFFRLWIPLKELDNAEKKLDVSIDKLKKKYAVIDELAEGRSTDKECRERNLLRIKNGKRKYNFWEDYMTAVHTMGVLDTKCCWSAFNMLDIYPNGRLDFCSWHIPTLNIQEFIAQGELNVDQIINSDEFLTYRTNMLNGDYTGCMACCPVIRELRS